MHVQGYGCVHTYINVCMCVYNIMWHTYVHAVLFCVYVYVFLLELNTLSASVESINVHQPLYVRVYKKTIWHVVQSSK